MTAAASTTAKRPRLLRLPAPRHAAESFGVGAVPAFAPFRPAEPYPGRPVRFDDPPLLLRPLVGTAPTTSRRPRRGRAALSMTTVLLVEFAVGLGVAGWIGGDSWRGAGLAAALAVAMTALPAGGGRVHQLPAVAWARRRRRRVAAGRPALSALLGDTRVRPLPGGVGAVVLGTAHAVVLQIVEDLVAGAGAVPIPAVESLLRGDLPVTDVALITAYAPLCRPGGAAGPQSRSRAASRHVVLTIDAPGCPPSAAPRCCGCSAPAEPGSSSPTPASS